MISELTLLEAAQAIAEWATRECMPVGEADDGPWDELDAAIERELART